MKKIGILGGLAWRSTVDYYAGICRRFEESTGASPPEMAIESLSFDEAASRFGRDGDEKSWDRFDAYHRDGLRRLEGSGADFAVIASNTPHHRFDSIVRGVAMPVLNLFEVAAGECARLGAREVLILGTELTMRSAVLRKVFEARGVRASPPEDAGARQAILDLLKQLRGGRTRGAVEQLSSIAAAAGVRAEGPRSVVCMACTELPLAFTKRGRAASFEFGGVTYVDTSAAHAEAAFALAAGS